MITQERLKEVLHYDAETGFFTWIVCTGRRGPSGSIAGTLSKINGYRHIGIDGLIYRSHRLAWLYVYGEFPSSELDHINRDRSDNRLCNIRLAARYENMQNLPKRSTNTSGHTGVHWNKANKKWTAKIKLNYKEIYLGYFSTKTEAVEARYCAKQQYHKFHPIENA